MPQYWNLTEYSTSEGWIGLVQTTSKITNYYFGYALIIILFIVTLLLYLKNSNMDELKSINLASLYTMILSIFFYAVNIINNSLSIWIFSVIFLVTLFIHIFNKER